MSKSKTRIKMMLDSLCTDHGNGWTRARAGRGRPGRTARAALVACTGLLCLLGALTAAQADPARHGQPTNVPQQPNGPVYNTKTKSYFELRDDNLGGTWEEARLKAVSLFYRGTRGRLAVVGNLDTHDFLRRHFKLTDEAWIGLRYWCAYRKLQWVTGDFQRGQDFNIWAAQWYRDANTKCGAGTATSPQSFMPVYYLPHNFRWQASGPAKKFVYYFVEYPTGAR